VRTDTATRIIRAPTRVIYRALLNAGAIERWRPPSGMTGILETFQARENGTYRMVLTYRTPPAGGGKSGEDRDVVNGRFVKLVPNELVVEDVSFVSDDPTLAAPMTITTALVPVMGGTRVTITAENVPDAISEKDHRTGMDSTLANLAAFVEVRR
jgi:uncharacterized protein YndB with AHSA1/START domain